MFLLVGLGNPGSDYASTRHNVGFMAVDAIKSAFGFPEFRLKRKFKAEVSQGRVGDRSVILAKPQTFMNASGESVGLLKTFYKIPVDHCIVTFDDKDLPFGRLRMREHGSSGGHNGVQSVMTHVKSDHFIRLRVGIAPETGEIRDTSSFVLDALTAKEKKQLPDILDRVVQIIRLALTESLAKAIESANIKISPSVLSRSSTRLKEDRHDHFMNRTQGDF